MTELRAAIGSLRRVENSLLGEGFKRYFPVEEDGTFSPLLAKLDALASDGFGYRLNGANVHDQQ